MKVNGLVRMGAWLYPSVRQFQTSTAGLAEKSFFASFFEKKVPVHCKPDEYR
jgi:hypothetical protein